MIRFVFCLGLVPFITAKNVTAAEILNTYEVKEASGTQGSQVSGLDFSGLKVAILDNGFTGFRPGSNLLPSRTTLLDGSGNALAESSHGMAMAQIVYEALGKPSSPPQFFLINANGFTNFREAVATVLSEKIDVVLYSQVWLLGSNGNGTGFIDALVQKALDQSPSLLWVNAAGNFGGRVWQGSVSDAVSQCIPFEVLIDDSSFQMTLLWNDFGSHPEAYSQKDLDLEIIAKNGEVIGQSKKRQTGAPSLKEEDGLSGYSREEINLGRMQRGTYCIQVQQISSNFTQTDQVRIGIRADRPGAIKVGNEFQNNQEVFSPADLSQVLTVGEESANSSRSGTGASTNKPDVTVKNTVVRFSDGNQYTGSSTAAALVAGGVLAWKAIDSTLNRQKLFGKIKQWGASPRGDSSPRLGFRKLSAREVELIDSIIVEALPLDTEFQRNENGLLRAHSRRSAASYLKRMDLKISNGEILLWKPTTGEFKRVNRDQLFSAANPIRSPWVVWTSAEDHELETSGNPTGESTLFGSPVPTTRWRFQASQLIH